MILVVVKKSVSLKFLNFLLKGMNASRPIRKFFVL